MIHNLTHIPPVEDWRNVGKIKLNERGEGRNWVGRSSKGEINVPIALSAFNNKNNNEL